MNNLWKVSLCASWIFVGPLAAINSAHAAMASNQPKAIENLSDGTLALELQGKPKVIHNVTLRVAGPNGYTASAFSKRDVPSIELSKYGKLTDGVYQYEMTAASGEKIEIQSDLDDGRGGKSPKVIYKSIAVAGSFIVRDGKIITKNDRKETE